VTRPYFAVRIEYTIPENFMKNAPPQRSLFVIGKVILEYVLDVRWMVRVKERPVPEAGSAPRGVMELTGRFVTYGRPISPMSHGVPEHSNDGDGGWAGDAFGQVKGPPYPQDEHGQWQSQEDQ
jgi:hypothetical protein